MLILTRQKGQSIIIGMGEDMVEVSIVDIRGDNIRLGITAPRYISVHRKEIYEEIQKEKKDKE